MTRPVPGAGRPNGRARRFGRVGAWSVGAVLVLAACGADDEAAPLSGIVREPAPIVDEAPLPDVSRGGEPFAIRAADGELLVVYFGFTNCPDVCPTTLADLTIALNRLPEDEAARVGLAMVTVDPDRDLDVLTGYVQSFVPDAHALGTDDPAALRATADPFGVSYDVFETDAGTIEVVHTSQLFVVDDQGRLVLTWLFGAEPDAMASDLAALLDEVDA